MVDFAGKQICDCCFEKIEDEILGRMRDILPWFARLLSARGVDRAKGEKLVLEIVAGLKRKEGDKDLLERKAGRIAAHLLSTGEVNMAADATEMAKAFENLGKENKGADSDVPA